jgi:ATP/maltotriose-dependent transcriptional regulator MalT
MAGETITDTLLINTKQHRPAVDRNHVHRSILLERLDQRRRKPSTRISDPAGYGMNLQTVDRRISNACR